MWRETSEEEGEFVAIGEVISGSDFEAKVEFEGKIRLGRAVKLWHVRREHVQQMCVNMGAYAKRAAGSKAKGTYWESGEVRSAMAKCVAWGVEVVL